MNLLESRPLILSAGLLAAVTTPALAQNWSFGDGVTDERWSLIADEYALCDTGLMQSPIDLGEANAQGAIAFETRFGAATGTLSLGSQKVQIDLPEGMGMVSGGKTFNLVQVHFHTPAEHAVSGERDPLVAHFVHATAEGELGVLGVTFREGAENPALAAVISAMESGNGEAVSLDLDQMVPTEYGVYRYMGSLTTPPCSEGVNWHVADTPATASAAQIAALREALGASARSLQPLGNRLLVRP